MKQYIPDGLALFRIFSAPIILYLLLLDHYLLIFSQTLQKYNTSRVHDIFGQKLNFLTLRVKYFWVTLVQV